MSELEAGTHSLEGLGLKNRGNSYWNLSKPALIEFPIYNFRPMP